MQTQKSRFARCFQRFLVCSENPIAFFIVVFISQYSIAIYAEKDGITILRHYIDRAYSAKTDNRPEFQNMIKDSGKRLFDMVIVWKLDRFARNRYDSARYKATLKKNGVKVVSATEVISEGAEGRKPP